MPRKQQKNGLIQMRVRLKAEDVDALEAIARERMITMGEVVREYLHWAVVNRDNGNQRPVVR